MYDDLRKGASVLGAGATCLTWNINLTCPHPLLIQVEVVVVRQNILNVDVGIYNMFISEQDGNSC